MARPRIDDVARHAGVSKAAVSFAFNQPENLNPATRERILAVAAELGYRPSPIARGLARRQTDQIGLVVPQSTHDIFANPFLPELVRGVGDVCDAEGIAVVIVPPVGGSIEKAVAGALVDGLILLGLPADHPDLDVVRRSEVPLVGLDIEGFEGLDVIAADDEGGARMAAEHLRALGHRHVAVVLLAEHPDTAVDTLHGISARRLAGTRRGFGIADDADEAADGSIRLEVISSPVTEEGGRAVLAELMTHEPMPTAVLAMSDVTAIGIMAAAHEAGLDLPADLSIVGFDDIPAAGWTTPRLTTVHQPIREKGRRAAQRLIGAIRSGPDHRPVVEALPTRLVVRGSSAAPRGAAPVAAALGGGVDER